MRRQLLSLAPLARPTSQASLTVLSSFRPCNAFSYHLSQCLFSSTASSSPLLPTSTPSTSDPTSSQPTTPSSSPRSSIRKPQRLWTPDYVSPSKHIMNYLTQHGPQTRRTLYAIFGPTPTATPTTATTTSSPVAAAAAAETVEAIAASPVVQSHPSCLRSKSHLTTILQQLTRSGRVLTKRAPAAAATTTPTGGQRTTGGGGGKKASGLFVYEMRDYATAWNQVRHVEQKGQRQRRKLQRLEEKAKQAEELAANRERRRQRLEAGMTTSG